MRIVIYKGKFQYDVVNNFGQAIGNVLEKAGCEVIYLDLNSKNIFNEIIRIFSKPVDFVLSFNGIGYNLKVNGQSLYDYLNTPIVMWLVDHPIHIYDRVIHPIKNKIVICIDETHVDYIENNISNEIVTSFIPHAAEKERLNINLKKEYDIVFAGHLPNIDDYDQAIEAIGKYIPNIKSKLLEKIQTQGNIELRTLIEEIKNEYSQIIRDEVSVLYYLDRYIRAIKRNKIISEILEQKIHIDFFGIIPKNHPFLDNKYFTYHGSVSFGEMKSIFRKSKIVLNIIPNFPKGGHERIFTSMMLGALPLTDSNEYIEKNLKDVFKFNLTEVNQIGHRIKELLSNNSELEKLVQINHQLVYEHHSWENRVEELLYVVEVAKQYFSR